jgi:Rad3-related DNA helicase
MEISSVNYQKYVAEAKEWADKNLGGEFQFRDGQIDCIVNIINNVMTKVKTHVCEAPTGTGKSLIAFIAAGVLAEYHNIGSYILCSDTALFNQYESDIKRYNLDFGCVCGKDNYICLKNGLAFSNSSCQHKQVSIKKLLTGDLGKHQDFLNCSRSCKYIQSLKKGHKSKVTVLTYQLWFSANSSNPDNYTYEDYRWKKRGLVICDEAHKLPEIVQTLFSPRIDMNETVGIDMMIRFASLMNIDVPDKKYFEETFHYMKMIMEKNYASESARSKDMMVCLKRYSKFYCDLIPAYDKLEELLEKGIHKKGVDLNTFMKAGTQFRQELTVIREYICLIDKLGEVWAVPSLLNDHTIVFNCAKEAQMVKTFFHEKTDYEFLMSATIGNLDNFRTMIASDDDKDFSASEADNGFDFSRSPIYYNDNFHRLSYREKELNLPKVMGQIEEICESYKGIHGIIQTGSYEFSKYVFDNASPSLKSRLLIYNSSSERKQAINNFESFHGKILIGPSLLEGLNFADDLCRFIIVMKVPYASLADRLVKAKMSVYPNWYINDVINKMVQGLGRGIRSKNDWCESYILDGCWNDVMTRSSHFLTETLMKRLKPISEAGI